MKYMLDTNICIYIIKKKPEKVFQRFRMLKAGDVCISSITLAELEYGVQKSEYMERNRIALTCFLAPVDILPLTDKAALAYGRIRAGLEKLGNVIGAYDLLIAAHCIAEDLILITNNTAEFKRIAGLKMENWV